MLLNNKLILNKFLKLNFNFKNLTQNNKPDLYLLNPKGLKCYLWLTTIENSNIICSIYYNNNIKKYNIKQYYICCDDILFSGNGTLLNGVLLNYNNNNYYSCNDIYYYKNEEVYKFNYNKKLYILKNLFDIYIKQLSYNSNFITIGLPIINNNLSIIKNISKTLIYNIHSISYINYSSNKLFYLNKLSIKNDIFVYFKVKPELDFDIYSLYCKNNIYYNKAFINDYKTSVMMNKLFRNIKENYNLDYLEESDDDEEFQNSNVERFVYLEKEYIMKCIYIKEFKSWKPICVEKNRSENSIDELNYIL